MQPIALGDFTIRKFVESIGNMEVPAQAVKMSQRWDARFTAATTEPRRMPLIPNDITFVPGASNHVAYVSAYGSDAIYRIELNADGTVAGIGTAAVPFINLAPGSNNGQSPLGFVAGTGTGFALNEFSRNLSVVAFSSQSVVAAAESAPTRNSRR